MLTILQRRTLAAAVTRILPSEGGPGAVETGVAEYCERALGDDSFRAVRPHVLLGLDELQARARELCGEDFPDCPPEQQDAVLRTLDQARDWRRRLFFRFLIHQTLEGFLGDPVHGGNRCGLGWRFIGYEAERVRSGFCVEKEGGR